jgi:hypothetical protein
MYYAISYAISGNGALAISWGQTAGLTFLGIAVGLSVITAVFQLIKPVQRRMSVIISSAKIKK